MAGHTNPPKNTSVLQQHKTIFCHVVSINKINIDDSECVPYPPLGGEHSVKLKSAKCHEKCQDASQT